MLVEKPPEFAFIAGAGSDGQDVSRFPLHAALRANQFNGVHLSRLANVVVNNQRIGQFKALQQHRDSGSCIIERQVAPSAGRIFIFLAGAWLSIGEPRCVPSENPLCTTLAFLLLVACRRGDYDMVVQLGVTKLASNMLWIEDRTTAPAMNYSMLIDVDVCDGVEVPMGKRSQADLDKFLASCRVIRNDQIW
jgi:hypothetical protein